MIRLNSILDHQIMLDRLNKIVTDGISKDQSRSYPNNLHITKLAFFRTLVLIY